MAQAGSKKEDSRISALVGFMAGMLADADALIRSSEDSLLYIEYHRHFSHSLVFIPLGGLIASLILWPFLKRYISFKRLYYFSFLAYASSGLLDACTSYGTQLLWPFSDLRIAWSIIAIVDPVFSFTLIIAILWGLRKRIPRAPQIAILMVGSYLLLGLYQHQKAYDVAYDHAKKRGHSIERLAVKPTVANLLLWRSIYQSQGTFYIDGIRLGLLSKDKVYQGESVAVFDRQRDLPELSEGSVLGHDIKRFLYFSDDFVAFDPSRKNVLIDVRYSMLPTSLKPLWGIDLNVDSKTTHADFINYRERSPEFGKYNLLIVIFFQMKNIFILL